MILSLVGSGEYLPPIEPVDRYVLDRLGESPRVACLPTAAGADGAERVAYWSNLGIEHFTRLGVQAEALPVIDRESANEPLLAESLRRANYVYISGGNPAYLYQTLKDSQTWAAIRDVLARGGALAGCSAGAMVMGERFPSFPTWVKAFNLLPGAVIVPHYDEILLRVLRIARPLIARNKTLVGIESSTALIHVNGSWEVVGQGGVTIWDKSRMVCYAPGETVAFSFIINKPRIEVAV